MADEQRELKIVVNADTSQAESSLGGFGGSLQRVGEVAAGLGLAKVGESVLNFAKTFAVDAYNAFETSEKAGRQLQAVIESTGRAGEISKKEIMSMADGFARNTEFSKGTIVQMETLMLQYDKIGKDILPQATQSILDFAARMGSDPVSASRALGLALQEPETGIGRLRALGVKFTEDQKNVIESMAKTGNTAGAQAKIMEQLNKQYGGAAAANMDTSTKLQKAMDMAMNDLRKTIGKLIAEGIEPYLKALIPIVKGVNDVILGHTKLQTALKLSDTQWKLAKSAVIGVGVAIMASLIPAIITLATVTIPAMVAAFFPFFVVAAIATAVVFALWQAWSTNFLGIQQITQTVLDFIKGLFSFYFDVYSGLFSAFSDLFHGNWTGFWNKVKNVVSEIVGAIKGILSAFFDWASGIINGLIDKIKSIAGFAKGGGGGSSGGGAWATGGFAGGMALVGEEGPEFVSLPTGSYVHNATDSKKMMGGNSSVNVTINNPSVRSNDDITQLVRQIKKALGRENELVRLGALG